jgi:argininosuccinate synthase
MFKTWRDYVGKTIAVLVSGGLDSTSIIAWLTEKGIRVVAITVNFAQPDETDISAIPERMKVAGAVEAYLVDGREKLAEYMLLVVQGLAYYDGRYLNTTGIARMAAVKIALEKIRELGVDAVSHGATGKGNDQIRFELALAMLAPDLEMYVPWRDPDFVAELGGRKQMIEYCNSRGLVITATEDSPYSTDACFPGLTHEAGVLESTMTGTLRVEFLMGNNVIDAPDAGERVKIEFAKGRPVKVNDVAMDLVDIFLTLNAIAGKHGVGIGIDQVENRVVGMKCRGVYESPAATVLAEAYQKQIEMDIDADRRLYFDFTSRMFSRVVYSGQFFGPLSQDLQAVIKSVARHINGYVIFLLYKGNCIVEKIDGGPNCLYCPEKASMEKSQEHLHIWSRGLVAWQASNARALAAAGQVAEP